MSVHLVTVGDSVRRYLRDPENERDRLPAELVSPDGRLLDAEFLCDSINRVDEAPPVPKMLTRLANADQETIKRAQAAMEVVGLRNWDAKVSAEATTFNAVTRHSRVGDGDLVVLLASDTSAGLLAAFWNAALMLGGDMTKFSYLAQPDASVVGPAGKPPQARGGVLVARVAGLDMHNRDASVEAMRGLGRIARLVLDRLGKGEPVEVHLSGGYKATMPFMIGIAEAMRSITLPGWEKPPQVRAWVVHEEGKDRPPIQLPLRRLNPAAVRSELKCFTNSVSKAKPPGVALEGYAYEETSEGVWRLTSFGEGFVALMGSAPWAPQA